MRPLSAKSRKEVSNASHRAEAVPRDLDIDLKEATGIGARLIRLFKRLFASRPQQDHEQVERIVVKHWAE